MRLLDVFCLVLRLNVPMRMMHIWMIGQIPSKLTRQYVHGILTFAFAPLRRLQTHRAVTLAHAQSPPRLQSTFPSASAPPFFILGDLDENPKKFPWHRSVNKKPQLFLRHCYISACPQKAFSVASTCGPTRRLCVAGTLWL